jgi:hypothetical protein
MEPIKKGGLSNHILKNAFELGFISRDELKVLRAIKKQDSVNFSSQKLEEVLARLSEKELIRKDS